MIEWRRQPPQDGQEYPGIGYGTAEGIAKITISRPGEETAAWARELLERSPLALRMRKGPLNAVSDGAAGMRQFAGDATLLSSMSGSEEAQEGRDAFREKRRPGSAGFPRRP